MFEFFLWELHLILGIRGKTKTTVLDICARTLDIDFERDRALGLGSTFGDVQTDRYTDTHTHKYFFSKTRFQTVETKTMKKSKSNF